MTGLPLVPRGPWGPVGGEGSEFRGLELCVFRKAQRRSPRLQGEGPGSARGFPAAWPVPPPPLVVPPPPPPLVGLRRPHRCCFLLLWLPSRPHQGPRLAPPSLVFFKTTLWRGSRGVLRGRRSCPERSPAAPGRPCPPPSAALLSRAPLLSETRPPARTALPNTGSVLPHRRWHARATWGLHKFPKPVPLAGPRCQRCPYEGEGEAEGDAVNSPPRGLLGLRLAWRAAPWGSPWPVCLEGEFRGGTGAGGGGRILPCFLWDQRSLAPSGPWEGCLPKPQHSAPPRTARPWEPTPESGRLAGTARGVLREGAHFFLPRSSKCPGMPAERPNKSPACGRPWQRRGWGEAGGGKGGTFASPHDSCSPSQCILGQCSLSTAHSRRWDSHLPQVAATCGTPAHHQPWLQAVLPSPVSLETGSREIKERKEIPFSNF